MSAVCFVYFSAIRNMVLWFKYEMNDVHVFNAKFIYMTIHKYCGIALSGYLFIFLFHSIIHLFVTEHIVVCLYLVRYFG